MSVDLKERRSYVSRFNDRESWLMIVDSEADNYAITGEVPGQSGSELTGNFLEKETAGETPQPIAFIEPNETVKIMTPCVLNLPLVEHHQPPTVKWNGL